MAVHSASDYENMGVDTNFTDVESQITSLYQYFNFPVMEAIESYYVNIM